MKPKFHASTSLARAFTVASLFTCLSVGSLFAASETWTRTTTGGSWSDLANWASGTGYADGIGSVATFSATGTQTVNLDTNVTIGTLATTTSTYTFSSNNGSVITLATSSATPIIASSATISATLAGTQGFTMNPGGSRTLNLSGNNTYSGVTAMSSGGRINVQSNGALGASGVGNGTTITYSNSAAVQLHFQPLAANGNVLASAEDFTLRNNATAAVGTPAGANLIFNDSTGTATLGTTTLTGNIVLDRTAGSSTGITQFFGVQGAAGTMNIQGTVQGAASAGQPLNTIVDPTRFQFRTTATNGTVNASGVISNGTLTVGGLSVYTSVDSSGIVRLSGANTYTGSTVHQKGTMLINNTTGSGTGAGAVTVASTAVFGGTGIIAPSGTTTVNGVTTDNGVTFASGAIVAPGDLSVSGTTISSVAAGKVLTFDLSNTSGTVNFAGGATISIDLNGDSSTVAESFSFLGLNAGVADVLFNNNTVNFSVSGTALADGLYTLATFSADNAYSGTWALGTGLAAYAAKTPTLIYNANSIQLQIGAIPEPSSFAVFGGVLALGFAATARRRRR